MTSIEKIHSGTNAYCAREFGKEPAFELPALVWQIATIVFALQASGAFLQAAASASNTNTLAPTMNISVNVQSPLSLTLGTGPSGCTVTPGSGGDYYMSFGNVNGLGLGALTCGVIASTAANSATYATTYRMTATYAGFNSNNGATVVVTTPGFMHSSILSLGEAATTAGPFATIPASGTTISIPVTSSGTPINRALAVTVSASNGGSMFTGSDSALVTFTLTVQ